MNGEIDFVVPYVDNTDKVWEDTYIKYCQKHNLRIKIADLHSARYEDIGLINYQLKLVEKNLKFIRKIFLLVSNKEQIPKNLSDKVVVVLHKDFIPYRYLPTFNSTTIEMFLWNIPGLSEKFIYANDDMLPIKPMNENDFFFENSIRLNWVFDPFRSKKNEFYYQCYNSLNHVLEKLKKPKQPCFRPEHSFTPMIKSHCIECFNELEKYILPYISAFRTNYQHNQYIYPYWENFKYSVYPSDIDFEYTELTENLDLDHQIVCTNLIRNKELGEQLVVELEKLCK